MAQSVLHLLSVWCDSKWRHSCTGASEPAEPEEWTPAKSTSAHHTQEESEAEVCVQLPFDLIKIKPDHILFRLHRFTRTHRHISTAQAAVHTQTTQQVSMHQQYGSVVKESRWLSNLTLLICGPFNTFYQKESLSLINRGAGIFGPVKRIAPGSLYSWPQCRRNFSKFC